MIGGRHNTMDDQNTPPDGIPVMPSQPPGMGPAGAAAQPRSDTGPLDALGSWFTGIFSGGPAPSSQAARPGPAAGPPPRERSAIEKMRDTVAEFDEDYK